MVYILQFNENTKHKFRRLYFIVRLLLTHKVTVYDIFLCIGILYKCTHLGLSRNC